MTSQARGESAVKNSWIGAELVLPLSMTHPVRQQSVVVLELIYLLRRYVQLAEVIYEVSYARFSSSSRQLLHSKIFTSLPRCSDSDHFRVLRKKLFDPR